MRAGIALPQSGRGCVVGYRLCHPLPTPRGGGLGGGQGGGHQGSLLWGAHQHRGLQAGGPALPLAQRGGAVRQALGWRGSDGGEEQKYS